MNYRVWDTKDERFVPYNVYLAPNNDLFLAKKSLFGTEKLHLVSNTRYVCQLDIGVRDKMHRRIYEGDICEAEEKGFIGVVVYVPEYASYFLLDDEHSTCYPLGTEFSDQIKVIGNICEQPQLLPMAKSEEGDDNATPER